jgi:oligopeptidase B
VDAFRNHLAIWERKDATPELRIRNLETGAEHYVEFPEPVRSVSAGPNPEFDTATIRFTYTSMVTPPCVIDYGMDDRKWDLRKQQPVLGGYDPSQYRTERLFARAPDGVRVPISVVYRLPLTRDGTRPMLLTGYGSYGITIDPAFSSNWVSLLDRGVVVALAHPRGGEDLGRPWYQQGKKLEKWNTFRDFMAVAEHLVKEKWTSPDRLAISGGSAGGLLMGVVLDPSIPLTVLEYEEWGNPNDPAYFEYMRSYSPYDNVMDAEYPAMLVTAGLNDPRVAYWEPAKWVARLRDHNTGDNPILLKTNLGAGHGGASGRYDYLKEVAFKYAFILSQLEP